MIARPIICTQIIGISEGNKILSPYGDGILLQQNPWAVSDRPYNFYQKLLNKPQFAIDDMHKTSEEILEGGKR